MTDFNSILNFLEDMKSQATDFKNAISAGVEVLGLDTVYLSALVKSAEIESTLTLLIDACNRAKVDQDNEEMVKKEAEDSKKPKILV